MASFLPYLGIGAGSILSSIFGKPSPQQTSGSQTSRSTSTPTFDPRADPLIGQVMQMLQRRLGEGGLPPGYEEQGISNINRSADLIRGGLNRRLIASGQAGSPVEGAAIGNLEGQRLGSVSDFLTETPLKEREMELQDIGAAFPFLNLFRGTSTTGTTNQTGTVNPSTPNPIGAAGSDIASLIAFLMGQGVFGGGSVDRTVGT